MFDKEISTILKGIGILLMAWFHLLGGGSEYNDYISLVQFSNGIAVERLLIDTVYCVSIFVFINGYSFAIQAERLQEKGVSKVKALYKLSFRRWYLFMVVYWVVFCIFVPIGKIFFGYEWNIKEIVLNFVGISSSINHEWWYVNFYTQLLLIAPIMCIFYDIVEKYLNKQKIATLFFVSIVIILFIPRIRNLIISSTYFIFPLAYLLARLRVYDILLINKRRNHILNGIAGVIVLLGIMIIKIVLREYLHFELKTFDFILLPIFIYAIILIHSICEKAVIWKLLKLFGKYSVYIWLMHRFFYSIYFEKVVSMPKYSIFVYIWLLVLCLSTSIILHYLKGKLMILPFMK